MHSLWFLTVRTSRIPSSRRNLYLSSFALLPHSTNLDFGLQASTELPVADPRTRAGRSKWDELMESLSRERANPSRVWNTYLELGSIMGFDDVPLEIQQRVLRKCVPRTDLLRVAAARRMQANNQPASPHIYESRLQTLISHMRANGRRPTIDDYNFVLEQFAAVGHQTGARHVFRELTRLGLEPSYRTYGLCLQAIAHRLTLPCPYRLLPLLHSDADTMCIELLNDMWARRIPMTSVNFDLAHRVFKETDARATFERLLLVGYGIDLSNPDRPPLDAESPGLLSGTAHNRPFQTLPFSTAALNTLVDMLGRTKQISKMVMAFEVFTTPLPPPPSSNSFSEDDDDDPAFYQFSSPGDDTQQKLPSAMPNTTTFNLLVTHAAKANHALFARHYINQAMQLDREKDAQLRADIKSRPIAEIPRPNIAVNRGTFLPPFGLANRTRHFAFLRWTCRQTTLAWKRKKSCWTFYTKWRRDHVGPQSQTPETARADESPSTSALNNVTDSYPPLSSAARPGSDSTAKQSPVVPELSEPLQMDLDATPPPPPKFKPLDLDLHISLLKRDVEQMGELVVRMRAAVERLSQRLKEKLGRRVWRGKDIFLMSHNERVNVTRREWMEIVKFQAAPRGHIASKGDSLRHNLPSREDPSRHRRRRPAISSYT